MSDEEIEAAIEAIKAYLAQREAGANAKLVGGLAEPLAALPAPPKRKRKASPVLPERSGLTE